MKEVLRIVKELQEHSGKLDKERIIKENLSNKTFDAILRFLFDDNVTTGIKRAKLNKVAEKNTYIIENFESKSDILDLMEFVKINNTGKEDVVNTVLATADYIAEYRDFEVTELVRSIICKDLKLGCGANTYNKANLSNPVFNYDVMAGKAYDEERALKLIRKGETLYFTEKIDGNRGTRDKFTFSDIVSRNGKVWQGTEDILKELNLIVNNTVVPDGEFIYNDPTGLMTSQELRAKTTSIMNDKKILNKAEAGIVYKIFELPLLEDFNDEDSGEIYETRRERMDGLSHLLKYQDIKYVKIIPVEFTVSTEEELKQVMPKLKSFIDSGKEGLMCIASSQAYKTGKGYQMMKLKNILSGDLKIIGWNYGKEKTKWEGKFASFNVEFPYIDKKGEHEVYEVSIGTGYSDEFRNEVNKDPDSYIGKIMEILLTEVSKNKEGGYSFSYGRMVEIREDKNTIDLEKHSLVEIDGFKYFKED